MGEGRATQQNDCRRCSVRNDGALATYCYHVAFETSHPGDGRVIRGAARAPRWCPGMVLDEDLPA